MGGNELKYIHDAFEKNWIAPLGPNVNGFEKDLSDYLGIKHVAALSSGSAAIHLALILLGVQPGDYVIVQSFTFGATAFPVRYLGATPVFVDSEPGTWNMDTELLEKAILNCLEGSELIAQSTGQESNYSAPCALSPEQSFPPSAFRLPPALPKAIIPVHLYGMPANMDEILRIANKYGIPVIEDAAEALGSRYNGKMCGSFGKFGILSFNGNKIITTSGGGALLSDDEELIKRARFLATQARDPAPHYQHSVIGYNYRMSNIVAGIGRGQLEVLEERVRQRRAVNNWYREILRDMPGVTFQPEPAKEFYSNFWLTCIEIDPQKTGTDREKLRMAFEAENIESRPLWKPMHLQPVFADAPAIVNGVSEKLFDNGLCLPSGSNLTEEEMKRIKEVLMRVFGL